MRIALTLAWARSRPQSYFSRLASTRPQKDTANVVIIGGGALGTSVAYHLAKNGLKDVVLLEKTELTAGSTWHAAGLATYFNPGINLKKFHYDSLQLYSRLEAETGQNVGFHKPGSVRLATNQDRMDEFHYQMQRNNWHSNPQWLITPDEIHDLFPILNMDGIVGGLYNPSDGHIDPYSLTQALATGARQNGAVIETNVAVTSTRRRPDGRWQIDTSRGSVTATHVVNAAGFWARDVGRMIDVDLPLVPIHHQYVITEPIAAVGELRRELAVIRDLDGSYYAREERGGLLIGPYEAEDKMKLESDWVTSGVPPDFGKELFESDVDRISDNLTTAAHRIPAFGESGLAKIISGPITYSPDLLPMVGPLEGRKNYWVACGFSYGIVHAGGAGRYLARWILDGEPPYDLNEIDPGRYGSWTNDAYTFAKTRESYGFNTVIVYPKEERWAGRPARMSTAYELTKSRGGQFGFHAGWEQPNWFALSGDEAGYKPSFRRTNWFEPVGRESTLVRTKVGLIDLTPFGKIVVGGKDSARFLNRMFANRLPKTGMTNLSHMLTPRGRVYSEMTVSRLDKQNFYLVTGSTSERHDLRWLQDHVDPEEDVAISNVTEDYGCLGLAGPLSRDVLACVVDTHADLPFLHHREVTIKGMKVRAIRISYTGELGYELHCASKDTGALYEALLNAGQEYGIGDFGTYAMTSLRLEKGFRAWGAEMTVDVTALEAGLDFFVKLNKTTDFIGKSALLEQKKAGLTKQLAFLKVDAKDVDPEGNEAIWHDNKVVGYTTSGSYGYQIGSSIAFAYLPPHLAEPGNEVHVELLGSRRAAEVVSFPVVQPEPLRSA